MDGYPARALLIDIAMQYTGHNNGKLVACAKYLKAKGWNSNATIGRARRDLIDCGLLIETRKGARPATHIKAEHCKRIDLRRWHRKGIFAGWQMGSWQWTDAQTGERVATIGYRSDGDSVALDYSIDGKDCSQRVRLSHSACNYGGVRPWFICPIRGERVAVLYLRAGRFACRHCQRLAYASQSGDPIDRGWRRQQKVEAKLGANWKRPKGMHRTTHERLMSIIWDCENKRDAALSRFLAGMMDRYPLLRDDPILWGLR